jgi:ribonucleotide reductase alpha subunit
MATTNNIKPVPDWMSEEAQHTLSKGYLLPGETPRDMWYRVASAAQTRLVKMGWKPTFDLQGELFDVMYKGWLGLASPVASNMGTSRGKPISCYSVEVSDSIASIYSHKKEVARMSQEGGGVGIYLSNLRPRKAPISRGGQSTGLLPWAIEYDVTARMVSQGGIRRGNYAFYTRIDHPDLPELLLAKDHSQGDPRTFIDSNLAVVITDEWMEDMLAGDEAKFNLFAKVLETRLKSGSPYLLFIDNVNNQRPECYKERGLEVRTSNLCVSPETLVTTDMGNIPIKDLWGQVVTVWNGQTWSKVLVEKTGENQPLLTVTVRLSNRETSLDCTTYHKWYAEGGREVRTHELVPGQKLEPWVTPEGYPIEATILSVEDKGRVSDTYCFNEPLRHRGMFNGILTGNCSEITLYTDENHSFVCVLSSLNLAKYDEWKDWCSPSGKTLPELGIWLLEAVLEEFITKARGEVGLGRAVRFAEKSRALGLGTMGLHLLYQKRGYPFASDEARELNIEAHRFIDEQTLTASKELASLFGEPEWCEGHGIRHTHRTAIAPTKTNSVISGAFSQGIEPIHANIFTAVQAKGDYVRKNPVLEQLLEAKGLNTPSVWNEIIRDKGSVQNLTFLSEFEKKLFLTAKEIDQRELIRQAADRQPFVDQAQSVNLFVKSNISAKDLLELHILAWKLGLNSLYYLKSESTLVGSKDSSGFIITKDNCPWCQKLKEEVNFSYVEISLQEAKDRGYWRDEWKTVPQLWVDGIRVGGYEDFKRIQGGDGKDYGECTACEA